MAGCSFRMLGSLKITFDDDEVTTIVSGAKVRLLAYLVLTFDMPRSRKQLAFDFWPDSTEKQAQSNLRKLIYDLRESFPRIDRYLKITSTYIYWNQDSPFYSDVRAFEQAVQGHNVYELRKAEQLYRGELLPGFCEDWLAAKREQLAQTYVNLLERLIFMLESQREYTEALFFANKLLVHNSLREESYRTIMRLYALTKDMAGVVQTYRLLQSVLQAELGIDPAEETVELFGKLTKNAIDPSAAPHSPNPLIGRTGEWGMLLKAWKSVTANRNTMLILKGEAGIGKTRLALEFKAWVESQGGHAAFAGCYSSVATFSYTPVTAWLRSLPLPELGPVWLSELSRLLPELSDKYPGLPKPNPVQEKWQLNRWYEAIERMLQARQPLLLILDDIQWSDGETLQLLSYLLRSDSKAKLFVIATMRTDEYSSDAVEHLISGLRIERKLTEVELAPLSEEETKRLMAAAVGDVVAYRHSFGMFTETGGNPLFIVETLREWQTNGDNNEFYLSPMVSSVILNRLNKLSSEHRQFVSTVAAVGRPVSLALMAIVSDRGEDEVLERIEQLVQVKVLQEAGDGHYDFTHEIIKATAYKLENDSRRRLCHRQIARGLLAYGHGQPEAAAAEIALHYELAGMDKEAIYNYEMAASAAEKIYANETRIKYYEKLCALLPPERILPFLMKLGEAWIVVGNWNEAERIYRHWLKHCGNSAPIRERLFCDVALGNCLRLQGNYKEAELRLDRARHHFEMMDDHPGLSFVYGMLGVLHYYMGNNDKALHYLTVRMGLPDTGNRPEEDCRYFGFIGSLSYHQCEYDQAIHAYKQQLKLAARNHDKEAVGKALGGLALVYLDIDLTDQAFDGIVEKIEISHSIGDRMGLAIALGMLGKYYLYTGSYTLAEPCIDYCIEEAVAVKDWRIAANLIGIKGSNLMCQHRDEESILWTVRSLRLCRQLHIPYFECNALYLISVLSQRQKRYENAVEVAEEALNIANRLKRSDMELKLVVLLLQLKTDSGRITHAAAAEQLQRLLVQYPDYKEQAATRFAMWRLNPDEDAFRNAALSLNEDLYRKSGKEEYLNRCREMNRLIKTAEERPMPQLAAEVMQNKSISTLILEKIDHYLNRKSEI